MLNVSIFPHNTTISSMNVSILRHNGQTPLKWYMENKYSQPYI